MNWQNMLTSWKSTTIGIAAIALGAYQAYMGHDGIVGAIHDPAVQTLFVLGVLGLIAKDHNVTGGTKGQPSTVTALAAANQAPATGPNRPTQVI